MGNDDHSKYYTILIITILKFQNSKKPRDHVQSNSKRFNLVIQLILDTMDQKIFDSLGN